MIALSWAVVFAAAFAVERARTRAAIGAMRDGPSIITLFARAAREMRDAS